MGPRYFWGSHEPGAVPVKSVDKVAASNTKCRFFNNGVVKFELIKIFFKRINKPIVSNFSGEVAMQIRNMEDGKAHN